jgi:hypothetical protein
VRSRPTARPVESARLVSFKLQAQLRLVAVVGPIGPAVHPEKLGRRTDFGIATTPLCGAIVVTNQDSSWSAHTAGRRQLERLLGDLALFFGTSGDVEYLDECISANGLVGATVAERTINVRGEMTTYFVRRLTIS